MQAALHLYSPSARVLAVYTKLQRTTAIIRHICRGQAASAAPQYDPARS